MDIVVLDTNVLLVDPEALLSYPDREIVLPEIILSELDKIKIARTDADTRFRARDISRQLFEYSEGQSLMDGVTLPNKGTLRIAPFDTDIPLPEGFSAKNPDDRIIVTAQRLAQSSGDDRKVTLITNDLNMLLKAQTLGICIQRHDGGDEKGFVKRFIVHPFQRYKTPLLILAVAIAIFAATVVIAINAGTRNQETTLPSEYRNFLTSEQADGIDALIKLQSDPKDTESLLTVAKLYYKDYNDAAAAGLEDAASYAKKGVQYYQRYLEILPDDTGARTDMAMLEFYGGDTASAVNDLSAVLDASPDDIKANYARGLVALSGEHDDDTAISCFSKVVDLAGDEATYADIKTSAQSYLDQIATEQENLDNPSSGGVVL